MATATPPPDPNVAIVRQAEEAEKARKVQEQARRKEEEAERARQLVAEARRRASQTSQDR